MSRMYIGVKADDPAAVAWAAEFARQRGWIDVRVESWLYVSGEAQPLLSEAEGSSWPAPPFKIRTTTADVVILLDDLVTPWPARPGGVVPLSYPMDVWQIVGDWLQVSRANAETGTPELWTRADPKKLAVI